MSEIEVLVVASKVKKYIKEKADLKTSDSVLDELTKIVMRECDKAIEKARQESRKTVLDRDFSDRMKVNV